MEESLEGWIPDDWDEISPVPNKMQAWTESPLGIDVKKKQNHITRCTISTLGLVAVKIIFGIDDVDDGDNVSVLGRGSQIVVQSTNLNFK